MDAMPAGFPVKACGSCGRVWRSWEELLGDPGLRLLGLQAVRRVPDANLLVFEHRCGTSVSLLTKRLRHLIPEHRADAWPSLRGTDQCRRRCLSLADHEPCDRCCRHARDRDLLAMVEALRARGEAAVGA
jgi:hypothetical protein